MKKIITDERWNEIKNDPFFAPFLAKRKEEFDSFEGGGIPTLDYSLFRLFVATGDRAQFQRAYFARRMLLMDSVILYAVYREEKYKVRLQDVMWAICDEYSWALPAHITGESEMGEQETFLDLFASETASDLSLALHFVGEDLEEPVVTRVRRELHRRVIASFLRRTFWHETADFNWSAVCACGIGIAFMLEGTRDEFDRAFPRFESMCRCFLSGYGKDACCTEGVAYWDYGFGSYAFYSEALRLYTHGAVDHFRDEYVHRSALFPERVRLSRKSSVAFSDGSTHFCFYGGLMYLLAERYDDMPTPEPSTFIDSDTYWGVPLIAYLMYAHPVEEPTGSLPPMTSYFEQAAWFIKRTGAYSFSAKGGYNDEPHNHNDLGHFTFERDGRVFYGDLGSPLYTRQYFGPERYTYINANSDGHSVPIVGEAKQQTGKAYAARVLSASDDGFALELCGAYPAGTVRSLTREFAFGQTGFDLTDTYDLPDAVCVTERFIAMEEPTVQGDTVLVGETTLSCEEAARVTVTPDTATYHDGSGEYTFWKVDFAFDGMKTGKVKFHFQMK